MNKLKLVEGMSGLFRGAGMSDAEVTKIEPNQAVLAEKINAHAKKISGKEACRPKVILGRVGKNLCFGITE